jgi:DNA helicase-2/ATP-dependent DNA helicase PcrA
MIDLLSDLNEPQRQAVTHVDGPLLVLAGAGSGKTRVITRRVAHLIQHGVAPWNILAITFTNKAAGEMRERIEQLHAPRGATVCTFHALCARLLREFAAEAGLSQNYSIYDRDDQLKLVKGAMGRLDLQTANLTPARVLGSISNAKSEMKTADEYAAEAGDYYTRAVGPIYKAYQQALGANNALDFDDLLLRVAFLLRDRPDVRELLAGRYRYILIDEYQDTNRAQYILAHGVALEHENICATGDPDQSIYAWRGADINNILDFEKDYPNATVVRLEENYRSSAPILATASRLIAHNRRRKDKKLWTRREGGEPVRVVICDDEHAEARQVVAAIQEHVKNGGSYSEAAIFYRVNSLSRLLEEQLLRAGVPYAIARGVEFYNRKEIKDVLAYLKLLANPSDDLSCLRIINTPTRGIGNTTVSRLGSYAADADISLLEACRRVTAIDKIGNAATTKVAKFAEMIDGLARNVDRPVRETMEDVVKTTGLEDQLRDRDEEDAQAYANVEELISTAAEFDQSAPEPSLAEYLHQISLVSDVDRLEGSGGAVTLMTLHAAKGLEFPVVFMVGCEDGLLPFDRGGNQDTTWNRESPELEEERRLAFVGMTRAMNRLTLSCARRRMIRGITKPMAASMFIGEIGSEDVEVQDVTAPVTGALSDRARGGQRFAGGFYAEAEERAVIEAMERRREDVETYPPEYERLYPGCRVRHPKFGEGKLIKLSQPWPQTRAEIVFDALGPKTIALAYTSIELLD